MAEEKFNLSWNDFDKSTSSAFKELLAQQDFVDVTLVSEDNKELKCHKVVLGASSPIFRSILLRNPHQHPLLYISGVYHKDLKSLLSFMYLGQTEVAQNELDIFMEVAAKFQIKGLSSEQQHKEIKQESFNNSTAADFKSMMIGQHEEYSLQEENHHSMASMHESSDYLDAFSNSEEANWVSNSEQMDMIGHEFKCEKCDYKSRHKHHVKSHMKAQHDVVKFSCANCDYKTGYSHNLHKHRRSKHTN